MIYNDSFKNWVFDLDNTLYDIKLGLFRKISKRITRFIMMKYNLSENEAKEIQRDYYLNYGLTLRGLIVEKQLQPEEFLEYVHDVEHPELIEDNELKNYLSKIIGNKIIFTNATFNHAKKILNTLNIRQYFDKIIDIKDLKYIPKPDSNAYEIFINKANINKLELSNTIFVEDTVKNLIPAKEIGMTTVWIRNDLNKNEFNKNLKYVDYNFKNVKMFLKSIKVRG